MNEEVLVRAALDARRRAYCPYSGYAVGAALMASGGQVFTGVNVENVAYPVGACAERVALGSLVTAGAREVVAVAVATLDGGAPCGMCRQALREFCPNPALVPVLMVAESGAVLRLTLEELLPHSFFSDAVKRT